MRPFVMLSRLKSNGDEMVVDMSRPKVALLYPRFRYTPAMLEARLSGKGQAGDFTAGQQGEQRCLPAAGLHAR